MPINVHSNHWVLAVINFMARRFEYFDSLRRANGSVLYYLRKWLRDERAAARVRRGEAAVNDDAWLEEWGDKEWGDADGVPKQRNGYDCAVFMCTTARYLAASARLDFGQEHMDYFRQRMVYELMIKALLPHAEEAEQFEALAAAAR